MLDILAKIRKSVPRTSSELRERLTDLDLVQAQAAVSDATEARRRALLDPDAKALDRAESALAASLRDLDRLRALEEYLKRRLAEAEVAEAEADLDKRRADADQLATSAAKALRDRYEKIATELAALVETTDRADDAVRAVNAALAAAGKAELLERVEERVWPVRPGAVATRPPFEQYLSLPARGKFPGIGDGYHAAQILGFVG